MKGSGLIIAFVVVVWAAYFIPLALRRYDEASKDVPVEGSGPLSRVISWPRASRAAKTEVAQAPAVAAPARSVDRPAARLAAKRRRRTLLTLIGLLVVVSGAALAGVISAAFIAAPVALIAAWLVACRIQVRGELGLSAPRVQKSTQQEAAVTTVDDEETIVVTGLWDDVDPGRKHVMENVELEADALDEKLQIAVPSVSTNGEALWDPLPVTLPTYVTKPRAGRTVRTIDFSQPGTWTSGHIEGEDTELPVARTEQRRAVGE